MRILSIIFTYLDVQGWNRFLFANYGLIIKPDNAGEFPNILHTEKNYFKHVKLCYTIFPTLKLYVIIMKHYYICCWNIKVLGFLL